MKRTYKIFKRVILVLLIFILMINIPIITLNKVENDVTYENWMSETLDYSDRVVDVAMLGAHDAFSEEIHYFSDIDPYNNDSVFEGIPGMLLKGYLVKQSKTQTSNVTDLLYSGVRYFDIRLSYTEENWVTKHNYVSSEFEPIAEDITEFLTDNPGEFLVLDFQHIHGISYDSFAGRKAFKTMLLAFNLMDYTTIVDDVATLTYGELTNNGTESKLIIIAPLDYEEKSVLNYDDSIRSNWPNSDDFNSIFEYLTSEAESAESELDKFRVMQAVTTMQLSLEGFYNSITSWSLINRADQFNPLLLEQENFIDMLETLPIVMVDNADSNKNNFHEDIIELIIEFNSK